MYSENSVCLTDVYEGEKYRFRIKRPLGAGGNGTVYEVEVEDYRGEPLAVKFFSWKEENEIYEKRYKRFKKEVDFLENNPDIDGILPILDKNVPDSFPTELDGAWYLMPKAKKYSPDANKNLVRLLDDMLYLATTLKKLHSRVYAHRDIKPDNILYYHGRPYLCDWGLIWKADGEHITGRKERVGPIIILPPELEKGDRDYDINLCKSDVYLFAKVLWMFLKKDKYGFSGPYSRSEEDIYLKNELLNVRTLEPIHQLMIGATQRDLEKRIDIEKCIELLELQRNVVLHCDDPDPNIQEEIRRLSFIEYVEKTRSKERHSAETYTDEAVMTEVMTDNLPISSVTVKLNTMTGSPEVQIDNRLHIRKREGSVFELFYFDTDRKKTSYWFIPQSITYDREKHELLISAKDMEINQKAEDAVPFKDSLNPMTKGAARSFYLESGSEMVFRG